MPNELVYSAEVTGFDKVESALKSQASSFGKTAVAAGKFDQSLKKINPAAAQATNTLTNFSRVIQDAPFGIIGVANNINPLVESFQRLKAESGSTSTALKSLAQSFIGGGGLAFAVSAVTSLLTVYALNTRGAGNDTKDHQKKVDEAAEAQRKYSQAVDQAASAVLAQQGNIISLNRTLADTSNLYNDLTKQVINQAIAQFFATEKEGVVQKIIAARVKEARDELKKSNPFADVPEFNPDFFSKDKTKKQIAELVAELATINKSVEALGLQDIFAKIFDTKKSKTTLKEIEQDIQTLERNFQRLPKIIDIQPPKVDYIIPLNIAIKIPTPKELLEGEFNAKFEKFVEGLTNQINEAFFNLGINISAGLGELLAAFLTKGATGAADVFKGLLGLVGDFLIQLGKAAIAASAVGKALKMLEINPELGLVAGLAAIVVGNLLKTQIPKFAVGTNSAPGGFSVVGERGAEVMWVPQGAKITPAAQSANMLSGINDRIEVFGIMRGQDIYFSNKSYAKSYGKTA